MAAEQSAGERSGAHFSGEIIAAKYQLLSVLGEGGMGTVWLARNLMLDIEVALKVIRQEIATADTSERLLREARASARLEHGSIVRVFDFGETEAREPFLVMEVLRGESLAALLARRGRLSAQEAARIALPLLSALALAHGRGVVHRDLKPDNILLVPTEPGTLVPKIVDFGIAKLKIEGALVVTTQIGTILGSPAYMSPEQARGREAVDHRTDLWAISVVLYEMLAGRRPFEAPNYNALLNAIIEDDPVPTTEYAAGDEELWKLIERGLEKQPDARWPSAGELGQALASWAMGRGIVTDAAGTTLTHRWPGRGVASSGVDPRELQSDAPPSGVRAVEVVTVSHGAPPDKAPAPDDEVALPLSSMRPWIAFGATAAFALIAVALLLNRRDHHPPGDQAVVALESAAPALSPPSPSIAVLPASAIPLEPQPQPVRSSPRIAQLPSASAAGKEAPDRLPSPTVPPTPQKPPPAHLPIPTAPGF